MRWIRLTSCLLALALASCSTVRVAPERGPRDGALLPPVRGDRAQTDDFPPADSDGYRPPARLAVILPATGGTATASASVRDGFLAAYYAETRRRPVVKFYDSQGTGAGALAAMARARNEGAQMIVGPLTRDEVAAVAGNADGGVPVIALNRAGKTPQGTTAFALMPEEEGIAAAERLLARNLRSVLVFANRSDNAERAVAAFTTTYTQGGGTVLEQIPVAGETADLTARLQALRAAPAPPQAVLMALDAGQGRAINAQLRSSALSALPRVATALILNGANAKADVELDGIEYPELPWLMDQPVGLPDADGLGRSLSSARGPAQRLFAFGADAWRLAAWFDHLYSDPGASIRGATGTLRIDITGPVARTPAWAVFSGGKGRPAPAVATDARTPAR
jgi:outer membrane PBP1 activator LpoA protein